MSQKISELLKQLNEACQCGCVGQPEGGNPAAALGEELSRKYYVAIAQILRDNDTKDAIADALIGLFRSDNPRFDAARFRDAAGLGLDLEVNENGAEGFDAWMSKVNAEVRKLSSMDVGDLSDVPYRDWYDDGVSPSRAARRAIKNAEMGENKKDAPQA